MPDTPDPQPETPRQPRHAGARLRVPGGWLGKLLAVALGLVVVVLVFAFSLILLAIAVFGGVLLWVWLKYRAATLRPVSSSRRRSPGTTDHGDGGGIIIEGQATRENTTQSEHERLR